MSGKIEDIFILLVLAIPILAIVGGVTAGIVKTLSRQRQVELLQRERIAAIERGLDPAKLSPLVLPGDAEPGFLLAPEESARRLSLRLIIGGIITLSAGIGAMVFMALIEDEGEAWTIGIVPIAVALGLLVSAWVVRASIPRERGPR